MVYYISPLTRRLWAYSAGGPFLMKMKLSALVQQYQPKEFHQFLAVSKYFGLVSGVLQALENIDAAGLHGGAHDLLISAFHAIKIIDRKIFFLHILDDAGLAKDAGHGIHSKGLVEACEESSSLQLGYSLMHLGHGIAESPNCSFRRQLLIRFGLETGQDSMPVFG